MTRRHRPLVLLWLGFCAVAGAADAEVRYHYTGNPFQWANPPYDTSMFIEGEFTIATALAPNLDQVDITASVLSASFTDQLVDYDETWLQSLIVSTDANGSIVGAGVGFYDEFGSGYILYSCKDTSAYFGDCSTGSPVDAISRADPNFVLLARNDDAPGLWTGPATAPRQRVGLEGQPFLVRPHDAFARFSSGVIDVTPRAWHEPESQHLHHQWEIPPTSAYQDESADAQSEQPWRASAPTANLELVIDYDLSLIHGFWWPTSAFQLEQLARVLTGGELIGQLAPTSIRWMGTGATYQGIDPATCQPVFSAEGDLRELSCSGQLVLPLTAPSPQTRFDVDISSVLSMHVDYEDLQLGEATITAVLRSADAGVTVEPAPECDDGVDNDGDHLVDLADPGCLDANDGFELDLPPGRIVAADGGDWTRGYGGRLQVLDGVRSQVAIQGIPSGSPPLRNPYGLAFDGAGGLYISDYNPTQGAWNLAGDSSSGLFRMNLETGVLTSVTHGGLLMAPTQLAVLPPDGTSDFGKVLLADAGNLYARSRTGWIVEIEPESGAQTLLAAPGGSWRPTDILVTSWGEVFVSAVGVSDDGQLGLSRMDALGNLSLVSQIAGVASVTEIGEWIPDRSGHDDAELLMMVDGSIGALFSVDLDNPDPLANRAQLSPATYIANDVLVYDENRLVLTQGSELYQAADSVAFRESASYSTVPPGQTIPNVGGLVVARGTACNNGLDDDNDGAVDTADPGCANRYDASEQSASFACDNGLDDDGDGLVDAADPGCTDPSDPLEDDPNILVPAALDFGSVAVGSTLTLDVTVQNVGTSTLVIDKVNSTNGAFVPFNDLITVAFASLLLLLIRPACDGRRRPLVEGMAVTMVLAALLLASASEAGRRRRSPPPPLGIQVEPGQTATIPVGFAPAVVGSYTGTLAISSNDPDEPSAFVTLKGTGS